MVRQIYFSPRSKLKIEIFEKTKNFSNNFFLFYFLKNRIQPIETTIPIPLQYLSSY